MTPRATLWEASGPSSVDATEQYTLFTALAPKLNAGGAVNCLLFIQDGTVLVSGGDDQIVRVWDVALGECLQELRDHRWGQITALSWFPEQFNRLPVLFIGTGRGFVAAYPFSDQLRQLTRHSSTTAAVFKLNDSVEVQALDSPLSRFAVASHSGQIKMFHIKNSKTLIPLWTFQVQDIPRGIFFQGKRSERLVVHTCCLGDVISCDCDTGDLVERTRLHGGIGSAALSMDRCLKAVYDLSSGDFDLYDPPDSLNPFTLSVPTESRLIKQCVFGGQDNRTLVCGGDKGAVHVFELGEVLQMQSLTHKGPDTFYAVAAFSTLDYNLIACGESDEPATIFVWRKPTAKQVARDKELQRLQADRELEADLVAKADMQAKAAQEALRNQVVMYKEMAAYQATRDIRILIFLLFVFFYGLWIIKTP